MSLGRLQAPASKDARPASTASTLASPAAGPRTGERKPKMPPKVSAAEAEMLCRIAGIVPAFDAADPAASAAARVWAGDGRRHLGELANRPFDRQFSTTSTNFMRMSVNIAFMAFWKLVVPVSIPRSCELKLVVTTSK